MSRQDWLHIFKLKQTSVSVPFVVTILKLNPPFSHLWKLRSFCTFAEYAHTAAVCLWAHIQIHPHVICFDWACLTLHTHCCAYSPPAFTHLNNCQLCVTLNFHLHLFGSSCFTGNGGSADQTTLNTCSPKCTIIHGNMHLFWQQSVMRSLPCASAVLAHVEASCFHSPSHTVSPHFITLLPLWAAMPTVLGGWGGPSYL